MDSIEFQALLDAQHGLLSSAQLRRFGYPWHRVRHQVDSGHWLSVLRGVISVSNGPLTRPMIVSAALVYGGPQAILSHQSALEHWGMIGEPPGPIHITVPRKHSAIAQPPTVRPTTARPAAHIGEILHPGVVVHRSVAIKHLRVDRDVPVASAASCVIDVAVAEPTARQAMSAFTALATNGRIPLRHLREQLELRRPRRYRRALNDAMTLLADGVQSALEYEYAVDVERAHGLPTARRQGPVVVDGRTLYEDVEYDEFGAALTVRLDGRATHSMAEVAFRDRRRDNAAELAGRPRLVFGYPETHDDPCGVFAEVRTVLVREGWTDRSHPCPRCA
ncbi:hypothetical protein [Rhodococcus daqingensis]|uniref:Transcriptional regulator, AbiEi antitoxin, Type IV TA system n=1 Tax=Rhodococcus daqingensis TaxID=2479363 RepID=A0ABW2RRH6_9NOCA